MIILGVIIMKLSLPNNDCNQFLRIRNNIDIEGLHDQFVWKIYHKQ